MAKWCTVAFIRPEYIDAEGVLEQYFSFGEGVGLGPVMSWMRDEELIEGLEWRAHYIEESRRVFTAEYEASSRDEPDPNWKGFGPRSKAQRFFELILYANLAAYIARPSQLGFWFVVHCEYTSGQWCSRLLYEERPLEPYPKHENVSLEKRDLDLAYRLHLNLADVPIHSPLWASLRPLWIGLCQPQSQRDVRYMLFWVALEGLLAPEGGRQTTYRLCKRIAHFLGSDTGNSTELFALTKDAYRLRSQLIHGMKFGRLTQEKQDKAEELMLKTEEWIMAALRKILTNGKLVDIFSNESRESYLEDMVSGV